MEEKKVMESELNATKIAMVSQAESGAESAVGSTKEESTISRAEVMSHGAVPTISRTGTPAP